MEHRINIHTHYVFFVTGSWKAPNWCYHGIQAVYVWVREWRPVLEHWERRITARQWLDDYSHAPSKGIRTPNACLLTLSHPMTPHRAHGLPIARKILYGGFNTRKYTFIHGFCFFSLFLMGGKELNLKCLATWALMQSVPCFVDVLTLDCDRECYTWSQVCPGCRTMIPSGMHFSV